MKVILVTKVQGMPRVSLKGSNAVGLPVPLLPFKI